MQGRWERKHTPDRQTVDPGPSLLRLWTVDRGPWTMDCGPWTVDRGLWTVDRGLWTVDCVDRGLSPLFTILHPQQQTHTS